MFILILIIMISIIKRWKLIKKSMKSYKTVPDKDWRKNLRSDIDQESLKFKSEVDDQV